MDAQEATAAATKNEIENLLDEFEGVASTAIVAAEIWNRIVGPILDGQRHDSEASWDDIVAAIVERFYKLAPEDYRRFGHKDLVFGTNIQDLVAAVWAGVEDAVPAADD